MLIASILLFASSGLTGPESAGGLVAEFDPCAACPADLDGNAAVDGADLGLLLGAWGPGSSDPSGAADLDGNGAIDGADLGILLAAWGPCPTFEYPSPENPEAFQIALELSGAGGPLLPSDALVERIARDLALIRETRPSLASQPHTPAFQWDFLILQRNQNVDPASYLCINEYFGATVWAELTFLQLTILQFPGPINAPALAPIYESSPHVISAGPSAIYGGENFWTPAPLGGLDGTWLWFVDDGFHDCFDGCDCHSYYSFSVTGDGTVTVLDEWSWGLPWCPWPK